MHRPFLCGIRIVDDRHRPFCPAVGDRRGRLMAFGRCGGDEISRLRLRLRSK